MRSTHPMLATTALIALGMALSAPAQAATDMPATPHQESVIQGQVEGSKRFGPPGETVHRLPATEHQQQALRPDAENDEVRRAQPPKGMENRFPATQHQEDALRQPIDEPTRPEALEMTQKGMPASYHQSEVID